MAALTSEHDLTTHANYVPEIWEQMVIDFRDKNLVMANLVTRRDGSVKDGGDKFYFPVTSSGTAVTYSAGVKLEDNLQVDTDSLVTLTIDQFKIHPFAIPWNVADQVAYDTFAMSMRQAGEAVSRAVDSAVHTEALNFTGEINAPAATAQTGDLAWTDLTSAFTTLNGNDVPQTDRAWVFHSTALDELLNITGDKLTSFDFVQNKPVVDGRIGMLLGAACHYSTNVGTNSEGSPAESAYQNLYFQKDAIALAMQRDVEVESEYDMNLQSRLGNVRAGYGVKTLRADHGVRIFTVND